MTSQEIREKQFERAIRGYKTDTVDEFLSIISAQIDNFAKEKEETQKKLFILAQKVEQYRSEEDMLKTAMLNAQRMGENVIKEAKQKAETIIREADLKAALIDGQAKAKVENKEKEYEILAEKVSKFKSDVLSIYKTHIQSLSELPVGNEEAETQEELCQESVAQKNVEQESAVEQSYAEPKVTQQMDTVDNTSIDHEIPEEAFEEYVPPVQNESAKKILKPEFEGFDFEKAGKMIEEDTQNNNSEIAKTFEFEPIYAQNSKQNTDFNSDVSYTVPFFSGPTEDAAKSEVSDKSQAGENPMFNQYNKISFND